jgi:O-antigen ligase
VKINVGGVDRALRVIAGIALIALALTGSIGAWGWIGVISLATGVIGLCPLYSVLGLNTCPVKNSA